MPTLELLSRNYEVIDQYFAFQTQTVVDDNEHEVSHLRLYIVIVWKIGDEVPTLPRRYLEQLELEWIAATGWRSGNVYGAPSVRLELLVPPGDGGEDDDEYPRQVHCEYPRQAHHERYPR